MVLNTFYDHFLYISEKCHKNLYKDCIESADGFGLYEDFNNIHSPHARTWDIFPFTGIPHFLKVCFTPLYFYKRLTLVTVFINWNKSEENYCIVKKKWKAKVMFNICFATRYCRAVHAQSGKSGTTNLLSQELLSVSQHQVIITLNCVSEHLCCISTYFMQISCIKFA